MMSYFMEINHINGKTGDGRKYDKLDTYYLDWGKSY